MSEFIFKPLSIFRTTTGYAAELSMTEVELFLQSAPSSRFWVEGVPIPTSTEVIREIVYAPEGHITHLISIDPLSLIPTASECKKNSFPSTTSNTPAYDQNAFRILE